MMQLNANKDTINTELSIQLDELIVNYYKIGLGLVGTMLL